MSSSKGTRSNSTPRKTSLRSRSLGPTRNFQISRLSRRVCPRWRIKQKSLRRARLHQTKTCSKTLTWSSRITFSISAEMVRIISSRRAQVLPQRICKPLLITVLIQTKNCSETILRKSQERASVAISMVITHRVQARISLERTTSWITSRDPINQICNARSRQWAESLIPSK